MKGLNKEKFKNQFIQTFLSSSIIFWYYRWVDYLKYILQQQQNASAKLLNHIWRYLDLWLNLSRLHVFEYDFLNICPHVNNWSSWFWKLLPVNRGMQVELN